MARTNVRYFRITLVIGLAICLGTELHAQVLTGETKQLDDTILAHFTSKRYDEALASLNAAMSRKPPIADLDVLMARTALNLAANKRQDAAIQLLDSLATRFPNSEARVWEWAIRGNLYKKSNSEAEMVAALEKAVDALPRLLPRLGPQEEYAVNKMVFNNLAPYYAQTDQWSKALPAFEKSVPPFNMCGDGLFGFRRSELFLCDAHLGHFEQIAHEAWRAILKAGYNFDEIPMYFLVRSYAEADQLEDLQRLAVEFVAKVTTGQDQQEEQDAEQVRRIVKRIASLLQAIENVTDGRYDEDARNLDSKTTIPPVILHVARWRLLEAKSRSVDDIARELWRSNGNRHRLVQLLVLMDCKESRQALVELATGNDAEFQKIILGYLDKWAANPKPLIAAINQRVKDHRKNAFGYLIDEKPFDLLFIAEWPRPAAKSLPRSLPTGLFSSAK